MLTVSGILEAQIMFNAVYQTAGKVFIASGTKFSTAIVRDRELLGWSIQQYT